MAKTYNLSNATEIIYKSGNSSTSLTRVRFTQNGNTTVVWTKSCSTCTVSSSSNPCGTKCTTSSQSHQCPVGCRSGVGMVCIDCGVATGAIVTTNNTPLADDVIAWAQQQDIDLSQFINILTEEKEEE